MLTTTAVVAAMCVLYAGYARITRPLLRSEVTRPISKSLPPIPVPTDIEEIVSGVLKWEGTPRYIIGTEDGNTKLIADKWDQIGDPSLGVVELRPFALVTTDPDRPGEPTVLQSESARIRFDEFDLFSQKIGKILGGELFGTVDIHGPDGLSMTGSSFVLDDRNLYSDHPVTFRFGPSTRPGDDKIRVAGRADKVNLDFHTAGPGEQGLLGDDLPPIAGIKNLWLRQNVVLDIISDESESNPSRLPDHLVIACDGNARYSVDDRVAVFNQNVRVTHSQSARGTGVDLPGALHKLSHCDTLKLALEDNERTNAPKLANFSLALGLRSILAEGQRLVLESIEDDVVASGGQLFYDLKKREAIFSGGPVMPNQPPPLVTVELDGHKLYSPMAQVQTTDKNRLSRASFPGPGALRTAQQVSSDGADVPSVRANWEKQVVVEPVLSDSGKPQYRLKAEGNVQIRMIEERTRVTAPELTCWIDESTHGSAAQAIGGAEQQSNPLRRILAEQGAHVIRPDLDVQASNLFELNLIPLESAVNPIRQASAESPGTVSSQLETEDEQQPLVARADLIGVTLGVAGSDVELLGLTAENRVLLEQAAEKPGEPPRMKVTSDRASIAGRGGEQTLTLTGGRSEILVDGMTISAVQIVADRSKNSVEIPGGGRISIPVAGRFGNSFDGANIPADKPLTVTWSEKLEFHGDTVSFFGNVIARQGDTEAQSDQLDVQLTRPVDFARLQPDNVDQFRDEPLDLKVLTFRHNVVVSSKEWDGTALKSLRTAALAKLSFDQTTQQLHGVGPGVIRQWTREEVDEQSPGVNAAFPPYRLTRVSFAGEVVGHAERRWLRLSRSVEALSGMVPRPLVEVSRDDLLEDIDQPEDAFWIGANVLEVSVDPAGTGKIDISKVQLQATGRVEIEGREFRAIADRASVDRSTGQMTIHGDGGNPASFWWQKTAGAAANTVRAREFRINPDARTFVVDEAAGFWGGR